MIKIATHDSATGERGQGFLSWLTTPFAKTQSKSIKEQYEAGCRMFDIRIRRVGDEWLCAHGCWHTERTAEDIISEIDKFADECYVVLTLEGDYGQVYLFSGFVAHLKTFYKHILWGGVAVKYGKGSHLLKVKYDYLEPYPADWPANRQGFLPLDGKTWHILLPIPWLWKKVYNDEPKWEEEVYTFVDFL